MLEVIGDMYIHIQYAYIIHIQNFNNTPISHDFEMIFICYIEHLADWVAARLLQ